MAEPAPMVRCPYSIRGKESEWVPMGRARTRCPRCGAELRSEAGHLLRRGAERRPAASGSTDRYHVVVRREDDS